MSSIDLGQYRAEIILDDSQFSQNMGQAENSMNTLQTKTSGIGTMIGGLAAGAIAGLGVALVGAGVAGVKMASDIDSSLKQLQAATGATDAEMKQMEESMKNIYNAGLGESMADVANSMALVRQNTGLTGQALEDLTKDALTLSEVFDMDVNESSRSAKSMMEQFGISGKDAMNLIAQGAQNGANKNGDLLDSLNEYSPQFASMGFSAEQFTNVLIDGAKNGQFSIDKVGDAMKEFNIRAKDGSKTTVDAFKSLGFNADEMGNNFAKGGETAQKSFSQVMTALNSIQDPMEKNRIGVQLFGTQFEDLEAKGIAAFANIGNTASISNDSIGKIQQIKFTSFSEGLQVIGRNFQTAFAEPIQQHVLPLLSQFSQFIIANMPQIKQVISNTFSAVGSVIRGVVDVVKTVSAAFADTNSSTTTHFSKIKETVSSILGTVKGIFSDFTSFVTVIWKKYGSDIVEFAKTSFQSILQIIDGALNIIRGIVKTVLSVITGDWKGAWEGIKQIVQGVLIVLQGIVDATLNNLAAVINITLTAIKNIFSTIWEGIRNVVVSIVQSIWTSVTNDFNSLKDSISSIFNEIQSVASIIWNSVKSTIIDIASNVWSEVQNRFNTLKNGVSEIFNSIKSTASDVWNGIKSVIVTPVEDAVSAVKTLIGDIKDAFDFEWELPELKLPKVSVDMKTGAFGIPVPDFNIQWNAKGGIADKTLLYGVGEAGREAIIPLDNPAYMAPFADAITDRLQRNLGIGGTAQTVTTNNETNHTYHINFHVDKMTGDQRDVDRFVNAFATKLVNGVKLRGG